MNPALMLIYTAICLDAIGIGLIFPILPRLLESVMHSSDIAAAIGIMSSLYALMQFLFAPVLGALSDQRGRRPVLLLSLAGAVVNYLLMAVAPSLTLLLLGRAIAGLTSANMSVAMAYLTDISSPEQRARRFGLFNAMFGAGFIIGPVLGGLLGEAGLRLPFITAAALNAMTLLLVWWKLPESHPPTRQPIRFAMLNPLQSLQWLKTARHTLPLVLIFFLLSANGEVYGSCWALWGRDSFHWNGIWIGLSLAAFGLCQSVVQASLPGPMTRRIGERRTVLTGVACACLALVAMAYANQGWQVFVLMPLFALGHVGTPALQALASRQVNAAQQGQFQGVLAAVTSLASIVAPLTFTSLYSVVQVSWPGAIWLFALLGYGLALPFIIRSTAARPDGNA